MTSKQFVLIIFTMLFLVMALLYGLRDSQLVGNMLFLLPPLLAFSTAQHAAKLYGLKNPHGQALALIAAGLLSFFGGELLFFLFQFVFHINPYPSAADIFYLLAYPLLLFGFMREVAVHKINWRTFNRLIMTLMILLILAVSVIVCYFGVFLAYDVHESFASNAIAISYGLADLVLLVPTLFLLKIALDYRGGKLFNTWSMVLFGVIAMMLGDILFAIFNEQYTALKYPYTMIDLAWVVSYLLFAYSFHYTSETITASHRKLVKKSSL